MSVVTNLNNNWYFSFTKKTKYHCSISKSNFQSYQDNNIVTTTFPPNPD